MSSPESPGTAHTWRGHLEGPALALSRGVAAASCHPASHTPLLLVSDFSHDHCIQNSTLLTVQRNNGTLARTGEGRPKKDWDLQGARNQETMAVRSPDVQIA